MSSAPPIGSRPSAFPALRWRRWGALALALGLVGLVLSSSTITIENGQRGVVERFGAPVRDVLPGIHLKLPWPLENVRRVAGPERSLRMPIGYRLIDERLGINPTPRQKEWLTGDNNIVELRANLLYVVRDAREYLYGVSGVNDIDRGSVEPPDFALRRLAESALTECVGRLPVDSVLTQSGTTIEVAAREEIQAGADALGLGVEITEFQLVDARPLASVERAFREVQDARARADRAVSSAQASANDRTSRARNRSRQWLQEANSDRDRVIAEARSKAQAFRSLHAVIGPIDSPAGRRLRLEKIRELLAGAGEVLIVPPGTEQSPTKVFPPNR